MNTIKVSASAIGEVVEMYYETNRVPYFAGPPGIAKTAMVHEGAKSLSVKYGSHVPVVELHLASMSEVDIRGYLIPNGDNAVFTKPVFWEQMMQHERGILFFDEFPQATHEVQKAVAPLLLTGKIGEHALRPGWKIVCAGNNIDDNAGANSILSHVLNRLSYIQVKAPDPDQWAVWAANNGLSFECIAFAKLRPSAVFDTLQPEGGDSPWCTARSLHAASDIAQQFPGGIRAMVRSEIGMALLAGTIGQGATAELKGVVEIAMNLPSFEEIIANPDAAEVPTDLSRAYAAVMLVAVRARSGKDGEAAVHYLTRFQPNIALTGLVSLMSRDKMFANSARMGQFIRDNKPLIAKFQKYLSIR